MKLEDLQAQASVRGILPDALATVVSVQWFGSEALELTYKTPDGKVANVLLYRHDEARLEKPEDFILAIVEFLGEDSHKVHYVRMPFKREPNFGVTSVNYDFKELIERAETPR